MLFATDARQKTEEAQTLLHECMLEIEEAAQKGRSECIVHLDTEASWPVLQELCELGYAVVLGNQNVRIGW